MQFPANAEGLQQRPAVTGGPQPRSTDTGDLQQRPVGTGGPQPRSANTREPQQRQPGTLRSILCILGLLAIVLLGGGCCRRQAQTPESAKGFTATTTNRGMSSSQPGASSILRPRSESATTSNLLPLGQSDASAGRTGRGEFDRLYNKGIQLTREEQYGEALQEFERIIEEYPGSEEASVAAYCIADIYFRRKANEKALEAFREIVEKYPGTHAAENAREGIIYLESFARHEAEFVSPEIDDRQRRGY